MLKTLSIISCRCDLSFAPFAGLFFNRNARKAYRYVRNVFSVRIAFFAFIYPLCSLVAHHAGLAFPVRGRSPANSYATGAQGGAHKIFPTAQAPSVEEHSARPICRCAHKCGRLLSASRVVSPNAGCQAGRGIRSSSFRLQALLCVCKTHGISWLMVWKTC